MSPLFAPPPVDDGGDDSGHVEPWAYERDEPARIERIAVERADDDGLADTDELERDELLELLEDDDE
jgi:hypothetical protein